MNEHNPTSLRPLTSRILALVACLGLGLSMLSGCQSAEASRGPKIGVVDINQVMLESSAGKQLKAYLDSFRSQVIGELTSLREEADAVRVQLEAARGAGDLATVATLEEGLEQALVSLETLQLERERQGQQAQEEGIAKIEIALDSVFAKLIDEGSYDIILNSVTGAVIHNDPMMDITDRVLELIEE